MIDVAAIQEFYRYNRWANARIFEAASRLTREQYLEELGSSRSSVRDTLMHIVWAEWLWLQRWRGSSPRIVFLAADFPGPDALEARWLDVEIEQRAFVGSLTADTLARVVQYVNLQGQTWRYTLWRVMYHLVNHSSYHRGQVTTLLRQLKARPIPTDFLVFQDEVGSAVV